MPDLFIRSKLNPILRNIPGHDWEAVKVYNPGVIFHEGNFHLFYRAVGRGKGRHSAIGYAISKDGEHFKRLAKPLLDRDEGNPHEYRGLEDPRLTKIDDTFYMAYAAYDGSSVRLSIATSKDLKKWVKHPPAFKDFLLTKMGGVFVKWIEGKPIDLYKPKTPERDIRTKAGGIFPEKIGGKYWMLFNEFRIWLAQSDDLITWNALPGPYIGPRKGSELFDNVFVEMGPPPIKTDKGWLVLYHGIDLKDIYRLGFILLDINDPKKIIYRSDQAIFEPSERYEKEGIYDILPGGLDKILNMNTFELRQYLGNLTNKGIMPEVIFCCGAVVVENDLRIYYGAGDTSICTATVSLEKILSLAS